MKSTVIATIVIPSLWVALAGCGCSTSTTTPSTTPDAATDDRADALSGAKDAFVGDVASPGPDAATDQVAPTPDAAADQVAPMPDTTIAGADARVDGNVGSDGAGARDAGRDGSPDLAMGPDAPRDMATTPIDGGSARSITLRKLTAYANCMPAISSDPIIVVWTVDIRGAHSASAEVTKATITVVDDKRTIVQEFPVDKPAISLVDGAGSADQRKPVKDVSANAACEMCNSSAKYRVDLVFQVDGESVTVSASGNFSCAY